MEALTAFANFFASAIRLTAPIALGTLACTISERAGVINIGIEGTMLFSGFTAAVGTWYTGSPWIGLLCGCLGGVLISAILGILAIYCNGQQIVIGIGINLFAPGLAYMLMRSLWDTTGISPWISGFESLQIPVIKDIPIISILFSGILRLYLSRDHRGHCDAVSALQDRMGPSYPLCRRKPRCSRDTWYQCIPAAYVCRAFRRLLRGYGRQRHVPELRQRIRK